jgi:hypothetical protein
MQYSQLEKVRSKYATLTEPTGKKNRKFQAENALRAALGQTKEKVHVQCLHAIQVKEKMGWK